MASIICLSLFQKIMTSALAQDICHVCSFFGWSCNAMQKKGGSTYVWNKREIRNCSSIQEQGNSSVHKTIWNLKQGYYTKYFPWYYHSHPHKRSAGLAISEEGGHPLRLSPFPQETIMAATAPITCSGCHFGATAPPGVGQFRTELWC